MKCEKHGIDKECLAGESAHPSNWYCSKCELEKKNEAQVLNPLWMTSDSQPKTQEQKWREEFETRFPCPDTLYWDDNEFKYKAHNPDGVMILVFYESKFISWQAARAIDAQRIAELGAIISEVHSWAVCGVIATPEDMMQNIPRIVEITAPERKGA